MSNRGESTHGESDARIALESCCSILSELAMGNAVASEAFAAAARTAVWAARNSAREDVQRVVRLFARATDRGLPLTVSWFHAVQANVALRDADYELALREAQVGRQAALSAGLETGVSVCSALAGSAEYRAGRYDEAIRWYEEALVAARRAGESLLEANALSDRSLVARIRGDGQLALNLLNQAINIYTSLGDRSHIARCLLGRGILHTRLGDLLSAEKDLCQAQKLFEDSGLSPFADSVTLALARVHGLRGDFGASRELLQVVMDHLVSDDRPRTRAIAHEYLGDLLLDAGQLSDAVEQYRLALEIARSVGGTTDILVEASHRFALGLCLSGSLEQDPIAIAESAVAQSDQQGDAHEHAASLLSLGMCLWTLGSGPKAVPYLHRCLSLSSRIGNRSLHAASALLLSRIVASEGDLLESLGLAMESRRLASDASSVRIQAEADSWITEIAILLGRHTAPGSATSRNPRPKFDATPIPGIPAFVTGNPRVRQILQTALKLSPRAISMLVMGETGTGKELVAEAIHLASERKGPFVAVNCGALPGDLLEAELFGHARGAYTGADRERGGLIEFSSQGTLFLDEIGDMPLKAQARLLRAIERGEVRRLGEVSPRLVDLRIVAATHRNLLEMVSGGEFRLDLYHRLSGFVITLPPLRERGTDVDLLVDHFFASYAKEQDKLMQLSPAVRELLARNAWPGNVRQLRNVIHRLVSLSEPGQTIHELPFELEGAEAPRSLPEALDAEERRRIVDALHASGWNKAKAAAALGASRTTLIAKMKRLRIEPPAIGARVR